ncbi:MAG: enoyl-CoA hydratase/isomerase family protein [Blastomonas fulva]|uniref:enoyl-CoA hydratase-related protein n=1 Tax=Blastomonas fulva TaxID=1550728 RepID=UPI0024E2514B|nr:enoyl-CoA hydratase-related protein [Blastomonas fulva]MDK2758079.1 enoyl-CoA hydratase/isomerase family protein [Blastomonas fulva]
MSDAAPPVLVEERGAIAALVLNRPRQGNSLSAGLVEALHAALDALAGREDVKVIILSGAGGRIFSAGHDLNEFVGDLGEDALRADFAGLVGLMQAILAQPQIVIAKVEGVATAAGCELVAACDLALASDAARFAAPGVNIGFWCHTPQVLLERAVGRKNAMMMLATGSLFPAEHALRIGLVNAVHPVAELDAAVDALASTIAAKPASVLRAGKASFHRQSGMGLDDAYAFVQGEALRNIVHPDAVEGISAFLEKRPPNW